MSVVRYVLAFCLVLTGTWLVMLSLPYLLSTLAFYPGLLKEDWQAVLFRIGALASGIGMWIIADMVLTKLRRKRPDTS